MDHSDGTTKILPYTDIYYFHMAGALVDICFADMEKDECQLLAHCCNETRSGLCHCLAFLGDMMKSYAEHGAHRTPDLCRLGHTLTTISQLIPALTDLSRFLEVELEKRQGLS